MNSADLDIEFIDSMRTRVASVRPLTNVVVPEDSCREHCTSFVLDCSGSMAYRDFAPTRFLAARDSVGWFLDSRYSVSPDEFASLIVFNDSAHVLFKATPIAEARSAFHRKLSRIAPHDGTSIAAGLLAAGNLMRGAPPSSRRRVVLLTDGGDGRASLPEANRLKKSGIIIDVIGIGGSPAAVEETYLRKIASVVNGVNRYRFISHKQDLLSHFSTIATDLMCVR